jgi:hypothetical protein
VARFVVPADCDRVASVTLTPAGIEELPLEAPVEWGQLARRPGEEPPPAITADPDIFGGAQAVPVVRPAGLAARSVCGVR